MLKDIIILFRNTASSPKPPSPRREVGLKQCQIVLLSPSHLGEGFRERHKNQILTNS
jgi:hypothetical protein